MDDTIDGLVRLMRAPDEVTGPINLGSPHEITVRELAERVIRLTGSDSKLEFQPLPEDDPKRRCPDIGLAKRLLDWTPTLSLDQGLERTIAYFRTQI